MVQTTLSALLFFKWWIYKGGRGLVNPDGEFSMSDFLIVCLLGIALIALMYYRVNKVIENRSVVKKQIKPTEPLAAAFRVILSEKSNYYNTLSKSDKDAFEKRVRYYMNLKMFTSEDGYAVTDEMKTMIAATAVQITFGLPLVAHSQFTHILIMPNASMTPRKATRNTVVVPWKEFVEGYAQHDDGQNEGMKVLASALVKDDRLQEKSYKFFSVKKFEKWEKIAEQEVSNFMNGMFEGIHTDERMKDEYFAQAVVYFFELPIAFKAKYPALYDAMSDLLNQDPAKKK
ncbi:MAG TPA: zinc-dependent peptidase [Cytophagaceae bacterium]|jgi:Mlc titration factor MtfA (ptsG expression regulator)|nr:zinc-dependent peptidase [Cytophagaceae bacterium]